MKERKSTLSNFSSLPDDCIAKIFSLASASPKDVCRAATVSSEFKSASESDMVWERFLPPDYQQITSRSVSPLLYATKKELYFCLCNSPILLDDGKLSFSMNKLSGKKSFILSPRKLSIAGEDNPMHWKWSSISESRFPEVAELLKISRLEIQAKIPTQKLSQETNYTAHLVYKLIENPHRYGLKFHMKSTIEHVQENASGTQNNSRYLWLETVSDIGLPRALKKSRRPSIPRPRERTDGWTEIQLGEFSGGSAGGEEGEIKIQLLDNGDERWKGGLVVEGIEVRPKEESNCFSSASVWTRI